MIDSKQFQKTVRQFIELYGDRTEAIGDEIHAGLAWIEETKFVLIGGDDESVLRPASRRRVLRLFGLAEQFRKPVLLWDVPFQTDMTAPITLLHRTTAQNSQLHLLKLPVPIIGVFDKLPLEPNCTMVDAAILLQQEMADPQSIPTEDEPSSIIVKVADKPSRLKSEILELLSHLSTLPVEKLVYQRLEGIRQAVEGAQPVSPSQE